MLDSSETTTRFDRYQHNTMNKTTPHPIEVFLAILLATVESALWLINELLGFHTTTNDQVSAPSTDQRHRHTNQHIMGATVSQVSFSISSLLPTGMA